MNIFPIKTFTVDIGIVLHFRSASALVFFPVNPPEVKYCLSVQIWQHCSSTAATPVCLSVSWPLCSPSGINKDMHCMTQHPPNKQLYSSPLALHLFCPPSSPSRTSQETDTKRGSLSGGGLNEPLLTMMKITTNLSLQEATVQWSSLGPAGSTFWLVDLGLILFRGQHGKKILEPYRNKVRETSVKTSCVRFALWRWTFTLQEILKSSRFRTLPGIILTLRYAHCHPAD